MARRHRASASRRATPFGRALATDVAAPHPQPPPRGASRALVTSAFLIVALVLLAFGGVAHNDFVSLDDNREITENPQVRRGLSWETAGWALRTTENANWYPLTRLSHLLDVSLFGLDAGSHHLVSVFWHAAAAVLLLVALALMTGAIWRSFAVAAVFAIHPLQVESVAWATERNMVLAGFFFSLTLLLWARYRRRPTGGRYAAALAAFAAGLAVKPVLVTLPAVLLLLDAWPLGRLSRPSAPGPDGRGRFRSAILRQAPFLALSAAASLLTIVTQRGAWETEGREIFPASARLANAALSYWIYLGKVSRPTDLAVLYPHRGLETPLGAGALAGILLVATTIAVLLLARRQPWLGVGWLWFLGTLVPMIGIVQAGNQAMADRFVYLPIIGMALAVAWIVGRFVPRVPRRRVFLGLLTAALLAALAAATHAQVRVWRDSPTLYAHALSVTRENWKMEYNLANELRRLGRIPEAVAHYQEAVRILPGHFRARNNLGNALLLLQRNEEAVVQFRAAVRLRPDLAEYRENLARALALIGRQDEAAAHLREAARIRAVR